MNNNNKNLIDEHSEQKHQGHPDEQARRDFIKKFGKLAAVTPAAMSVLMSPSTSAAPTSDWCRTRPNHQRCR